MNTFKIGQRVHLVEADNYHQVGTVKMLPGFVEPEFRHCGPVEWYSVDFWCSDGVVENCWLAADEMEPVAETAHVH